MLSSQLSGNLCLFKNIKGFFFFSHKDVLWGSKKFCSMKSPNDGAGGAGNNRKSRRYSGLQVLPLGRYRAKCQYFLDDSCITSYQHNLVTVSSSILLCNKRYL